ncbi:uncharacterized protein LOC135348992 [Halichondria panicea]|uniref:uncharacterized protein LOC135348992 n=1 Tax=Halichondria panicea TaxID=6063 RepID=UPI00312B8D4A
MLKYWFEKGNKGKPFYIGDKIEFCNKRLLGIKVPDIISRVPHTLHEFKHWKGSQLKAWLLYFAVPVLCGVLPATFMNHFYLLVAAAHFLSSEMITSRHIDLAEGFLTQFYMQMSALYGKKKCTMNFHMLSHFTECVRNWGPLWVYSCFHFESMNGQLKSFFHGTRDMTQQAIFSFAMMQSLPSLAISSECPQMKALLEVLFDRKKQACHPTYTGLPTAVVGGNTLMLPSPTLQAVCPEVRRNSRINVFYRLSLQNCLYYSKKYHRVKKRNSYTVKFLSTGGSVALGQIDYFILLDNSFLLAVVTKAIPNALMHEKLNGAIEALDKVIVPVSFGPGVEVIPVLNILCKCVCVDILSTEKYIILIPNTVFGD